jgi:membrane protease YdiL (CAAX protease family)
MINLLYLTVYYIVSIVAASLMFKIQKKYAFFGDKVSLYQFSPLIVFFLFVVFGIATIGIINIDFDYLVIRNSLLGCGIILLVFIISFFLLKFLYKQKVNIETSHIRTIILGMLIGVFVEEIGWRIYLPFLLKDIFSWELTYLLIGLLLGLWHYWHFKHGFRFMLFFVILNMSYSFLIGSFLTETNGNLFVPSLIHFVLGMCFFVFFRTTWNNIIVIRTLSIVSVLAALFVKFVIY